MDGIEPTTYGLQSEVCLIYGTYLICYKEVRCYKRKETFGIIQRGLSGTEILHLSGIANEVTPHYGNHHLLLSFYQRTLLLFSDCKIRIPHRNLFA